MTQINPSFIQIVYALECHRLYKAKSIYSTLTGQEQTAFAEWLDDSYHYEQYDNDDFETLTSTLNFLNN